MLIIALNCSNKKVIKIIVTEEIIVIKEVII